MPLDPPRPRIFSEAFCFGPAVVAYCGVVGPQSKYEFKFFGRHLCGRCRLRLPKNLFADHKISPLFSREVLCNQLVTRAAEIINIVGAILPT